MLQQGIFKPFYRIAQIALPLADLNHGPQKCSICALWEGITIRSSTSVLANFARQAAKFGLEAFGEIGKAGVAHRIGHFRNRTGLFLK